MASLPSREEFIKSMEVLVRDFDCAICGEKFNEEHPPVKLDGCGHIFGLSCLTQWFESSNDANTCPMCRREMFLRPGDEDVELSEAIDIINSQTRRLLREFRGDFSHNDEVRRLLREFRGAYRVDPQYTGSGSDDENDDESGSDVGSDSDVNMSDGEEEEEGEGTPSNPIVIS